MGVKGTFLQGISGCGKTTYAKFHFLTQDEKDLVEHDPSLINEIVYQKSLD
jgi:hypothetical protein